LYLRFDDINGNTQNDVQIDFSSSGSTFSVNGTSYNIYDAEGNVTSADDMTYQQLNDVVAMVASGNLPTSNDKAGYDDAVERAKGSVDVSLDYRGRMQIKDKLNASSKIKFSMYDSSSNDFSSQKGNSLSFMSNNAITVDEPSIDFFKDLDQMIQAVRDGKFSADATSAGDPRNMGIENAIRRLDHVSDHIEKEHTKIGSLSNALNTAYQRSDLLSIQVQTLQSQISDVDIAEAIAKYNQVSISYQAMLSTIAKVNSMSLLNYM
jgi:flagellar hook-associated protein 3 FlgL